MKFENYINEKKKVIAAFHDVSSEYMADNYKKSFKDVKPSEFMKMLEKYDYKSLVSLFELAGVKSIAEFVKIYKKDIEEILQ